MADVELTQEQRHDLYVHVQNHHAAMPPYDAPIEEVHAWLHDDAFDPSDDDHPADLITLPSKHEYPTHGPRTYTLGNGA